MYATLHRTSGTPAEAPDAALRLRQIGGPLTLTVTLSTERPADAGAFEVRQDCPLTEPDAVAAVAQVLTFAGPVSDAMLAAGERAGRERIAPAMISQPGGVRQLKLWHPELRRQIIMTLATSLEALEEAGKKIQSLPLLPDEDVALLPGPDHVEIFRVES
ncbi:MAG TPA: hypothetical protein VGO94_09180 [Mycobacteriales bacterium]|jgi:hypothetical protein|nr:hypothetical protein [Mycobacteriales bacterium]